MRFHGVVVLGSLCGPVGLLQIVVGNIASVGERRLEPVEVVEEQTHPLFVFDFIDVLRELGQVLQDPFVFIDLDFYLFIVELVSFHGLSALVFFRLVHFG